MSERKNSRAFEIEKISTLNKCYFLLLNKHNNTQTFIFKLANLWKKSLEKDNATAEILSYYVNLQRIS